MEHNNVEQKERLNRKAFGPVILIRSIFSPKSIGTNLIGQGDEAVNQAFVRRVELRQVLIRVSRSYSIIYSVNHLFLGYATF